MQVEPETGAPHLSYRSEDGIVVDYSNEHFAEQCIETVQMEFLVV